MGGRAQAQRLAQRAERLRSARLALGPAEGSAASHGHGAERLGVAEKTVKNHITSLLSKMGLQRRTKVAEWVAGRKHSAWRNEPSD